MNHSDIRGQLADYLEGQLDLSKRALFDAHLDECAECARDVAEMRATVGLLRSLPDPEPPPTLVPVVMQRVRAGEAETTFADRLRSWWSELSAPGIAIPATALVAAFLVQVWGGDFRWADLFDSGGGHARPALQAAAPAAPSVPGAAFAATPARQAEILEAIPVGSSFGPRPQRARMRRAQPSFPASGPRTADDWLAVLARSPVSFARAQSVLTLAEQELWARQLARRATERGIAHEVVEILRDAGTPEALTLADELAAEADRIGATGLR